MIVPRGMSGIVQDLASAIARQENANPAYNNPGALRAGPGQIGTSASGFAIFPDYATGEAALENQIQLNIGRGLTLQQFFAGQRDASGNVIPGGYPGYAPAADANQPNVYAQNVAAWAGIPANVPMNQLGVAPSLDTSAIDNTSSVIDLSGFSGSGWIWGGAVAAVLLLALALER